VSDEPSDPLAERAYRRGFRDKGNEREDWADVLRRRAPLATSLAPYGVIVDAWAAWAPGSGGEMTSSADACAARWREGVPLLARAPIDIPSTDVEDLMAAAMEAVTAVAPQDAAAMRRLADDWDAGRIGPAAFLPSRGAIAARASEQLSLRPEVAAFLAYAGLRPAVEHALAPVQAHVTDGHWSLGICPFCGAPPAFADIVEDGRRRLSCHLCGGTWAFSRVRCPFCGADAAHGLVRLEPDGADAAYFIVGCTRCRAYVKEIDRRQRWNARYALVEDWGSPHFDLVARRQGYWRAVPTLLEVATPA
jgi:FdhE protein